MMMESMPLICRRSVLAVAIVLLASANTCRAGINRPSAGIQPGGVQPGSVEQSPTDEMQREWDELLYHCRGILPPRPVRRLGSEFLGKRSSSSDGGPSSLTDAAVQWCSDKFSQSHWLCTCLFPTSDSSSETVSDEDDDDVELAPRPAKRGLGAILLSGKRMNKQWSIPMNRRIMGSEFLGKRAIPLGSEFLGKRARPLGSEFLGKRSVIPPSIGVHSNN